MILAGYASDTPSRHARTVSVLLILLTCLLAQPSALSAETNGNCGKGFFSSRQPAGHGWTYILPSIGQGRGVGTVTRAISHPNDPSGIYLVTKDQIVHSRDRGCTWATSLSRDDLQATVPSGIPEIRDLVVIPTKGADRLVALVVAYSGIVNDTQILTRDPADAEWRKVEDPDLPPVATASALSSDPAGKNIYLAASAASLSNATHGFFVSENGGRDWERRSPPGLAAGEVAPSAGTLDVTVDAMRPDTVWISEQDAFWRSTDAGLTWERVDGPGGESSRVLAAARSAVLATCENGGCIATSFDEGRSWTTITSPRAAGVIDGYIHPVNERILVSLAGDEGATGVWLMGRGGWTNLRAPFDGSGFSSAMVSRAPLLIWDSYRGLVAEYGRRW